MHVLFLTANTEFLKPEGGKEKLLLQGMLEAAEVLHIIVLTPWGSTYTSQKLRENAWVYPTNAFPGFQFFKILTLARFELYWQKQFRAHIIHSDDTQITGWAGLVLSYIYDRVWIVNIRTHRWSMPLWLVFTQAFNVCIFSDTTRLYLLPYLRTYWEKKIILFPRLYDVDTLDQEAPAIDIKTIYPKFAFVIMTVARMGGGGPALAALKLLRKDRSYQKAGMVVIAGGFAGTLVHMRAFFLGLSGWVRIVRPSPVLTSYLKTANIFLYLSKGKENEDLLIRAAAAHSPIIAIDDVLAREVIRDGINGSIVRHPNPKELVAFITTISQGEYREIFRVNSSMNLKQVVIASPAEVLQTIKQVWEYEAAPEPEPPIPTLHMQSVKPPPPTKLEHAVEEAKETLKEMFPSEHSKP